MQTPHQVEPQEPGPSTTQAPRQTPSRTVLITGGAGGIGKEIAHSFLSTGHRVVLVDTDLAHTESVTADLRSAYPTADLLAITLDITDVAAVTRTMRTLTADDSIDVLVNSAGVLSLHGPVVEFPLNDFRTILEVNVLGTFAMIQAFGQHRIAVGGGGSIVNISSIGGRQPTRGMGAYESSKAAVDSLTRWAALELAAHRIRVNAIAPGPVLTPALAQEMPPGSPARSAWTQRIPLGDLAQVSDVAAAALFLAGDAATHITGISLPVDGGQLLT